MIENTVFTRTDDQRFIISTETMSQYYIRAAGQIVKVIEKNDGVNIYEAGQTVKVVMDPKDVMAYPAQ